MSILHVALVGLIAVAASVAPAQAQLHQDTSCKLPTLPPSQATKLEWQIYGSNMKTYQACMSAKAEKAGQVAKKALETVGEGTTRTKEGLETVGGKVLGWKESATEWFSN